MAKKKATNKNGLAWSMVFLAIALLCFVLLIGVYTMIGFPIVWPLLGGTTAIISIFLLKREKKEGKLGKKNWLWSIFTTAVMMGIALYMAQTQPTMVALIATGASLLALIVLIKEKYSFN